MIMLTRPRSLQNSLKHAPPPPCQNGAMDSQIPHRFARGRSCRSGRCPRRSCPYCSIWMPCTPTAAFACNRWLKADQLPSSLIFKTLRRRRSRAAPYPSVLRLQGESRLVCEPARRIACRVRRMAASRCSRPRTGYRTGPASAARCSDAPGRCATRTPHSRP